jgi:hypothetical protein
MRHCVSTLCRNLVSASISKALVRIEGSSHQGTHHHKHEQNGKLEIWFNERGRDLLVRELQHLSMKSDHFYLDPKDMGEVEMSSRPCRDSDRLIE